MGLLDDLQKYFGEKDLYKVLDVERTANDSQIKKAYRKLSLKVHPDRASDEQKPEATRKFQVLHKVHFILTNEEARKVYDETGTVLDEGSLESAAEWDAYWRLLFPKITKKDIDKFLAEYRDSPDEEADIEKYYNRFEGDMDKISECVIGFEEDRIRKKIEAMIEDERLSGFDAFVNEPKKKKEKRLKKAEKEARLADKEAKKKKKRKAHSSDDNDEDDLVKAIQLRSKANFDNLIQGLEAKYGKPNPTKKSKKRK